MTIQKPSADGGTAFPLPSAQTLVQSAIALRPDLAERAAATEGKGRVSSEITTLLKSAGLLNIMKPARFGGYDMPPSVLIDVVYELGRGCGSTAWCTSVANTTAWCAAFWPLTVQAEIWKSSNDNLVSGAVTPTGKCERVEGGFQINGRWPFASNCDNCDWMIVAAFVPEGTDGKAGTGWFLLPCNALQIDQHSWNVAGLQGTGSKTVFAETPIFVPEERLVFFTDVVDGIAPGYAIPGNILTAYPFTTFGGACLAAPLLGMARGALDWFVEAMQAKARIPLKTGVPVSAAHSPFAQARVGAASAMIDAGLTLLQQTVREAEAKIQAGETLTSDERVKVRRDSAFAAQQARDAVNLLAEGAGASSSDRKTAIQRLWRDVNAGARHVSLDIEAINALVGQQRFGLPLMGAY